jgi:transcriptional regulator with XRE-family HTH domain
MASNHMTAREFVGREVRRAREAKGLTRGELAKMFPVSVSLVGKWETGRRLPTGRNFEKLVEFLGIGEDAARIVEEIVLELVGNEVSPDWFKLPEVEAQAGLLWTFESTVIPGLLQTEEYCRAIQQAANLPTDPEERVDARLNRQKILGRDDPPKLVALIPESVLRNNVGGAKIMHDQLLHLASMAERQNIHVHVIPQRSPACAGFISGFVIATLDGKEMAYVDNQLNGDMTDAAEDVDRLRRFFEEFRADALNRRDSIDLIRRMAEEWQS